MFSKFLTILTRSPKDECSTGSVIEWGCLSKVADVIAGVENDFEKSFGESSVKAGNLASN